MNVLLIPINHITIDLIGELNGGLRPVIENDQTLFVYRGPDEHANIITLLEAEKMMNEKTMNESTIVELLSYKE